ncbi:DUF6506 family protein [Photobacterium sagamiensis]|uniref:DUF6506 family protein n=1 Tax=Photobacterium sagamiensis TaxID=2910241 RepID=UPI003D110C08
MIRQYGFIVKAANYDYKKDCSVLETALFRTKIVGVRSDMEAVIVAKDLIHEGVQVIELCGGFGKKSADKIISEVNSNVPIGFVTFSEKEELKLSQLISGENEAINQS